MQPALDHNTIFNIKLTNIDVASLINQIIVWISEDCRGRIINNLNVHAISLANKNVDFREAINQSDIVFCDGYGVKLAATLLAVDVGERMTPPDWIDDLFKVAEQKSYRVFFLGDEETVIQKFVMLVNAKFPNLIVAGFHHGFFHHDSVLGEQIIRDISTKTIDVLIVGMGMPLQETWIKNNRNQLNAKVIMSVGALFRWYARIDKRGPRFLTDNGFEWLTRMLMYPKGVWKRYCFEIPQFLILVLREKIRMHKSGTRSC